MVLWLKLGKLIVIRTLKGRWNESVILSLGQTSALDTSRFPQTGKDLKMKHMLPLTFPPRCHGSEDCSVCPLGGLDTSSSTFVCKDFLGYPRQESHFVWFPHLCSTRENLRLKKTVRFAKSHTAAGTASPPVSEPDCPLDKVIDPRE